jgi:hypothetical protein
VCCRRGGPHRNAWAAASYRRACGSPVEDRGAVSSVQDGCANTYAQSLLREARPPGLSTELPVCLVATAVGHRDGNCHGGVSCEPWRAGCVLQRPSERLLLSGEGDDRADAARCHYLRVRACSTAPRVCGTKTLRDDEYGGPGGFCDCGLAGGRGHAPHHSNGHEYRDRAFGRREWLLRACSGQHIGSRGPNRAPQR